MKLWWILFFITFSSVLIAEDKVYVYYSTLESITARQKALKKDPSIKRFNKFVFGQEKDFKKANETEPADIVIASSFFSKFNPDYIASLQFTKKLITSEKYILISIHKKWKFENTKDGVVGVVREHGRVKTKSFVKNILPKVSFKKVKTITKEENLFTLLALENADYIIIRESSLKQFRKKQYANAEINIIEESKEVGFPVVYIRRGVDKSKLKPFQELSPKTLKALGFTGVKKIKINETIEEVQK